MPWSEGLDDRRGQGFGHAGSQEALAVRLGPALTETRQRGDRLAIGAEEEAPDHWHHHPRQPVGEEREERADGADAGDNPAPGQPVRDPGGGGQRVRAATGEAHDGEAVEWQCSGEVHDVCGPVEQAATGLVVRETQAGPIDPDEPHTIASAGLGQEARFESGSGMAMEVDDGSA